MASPTTVKRQMQREESQQHAAVVLYNRLAAHFLNECLPQGALLPGIAQSADTFKAKLTNPVNYRADGILKQKAATDNLWTLTGATRTSVVPYLIFFKYLLLLDAAGTASVYESGQSIVSLAAVPWNLTVGAGGALPWDGKAIIGYLTFQLGTTSTAQTFTPGSSNLAQATMTVTYNDGSPAELLPQIADLFGVVASSALY
jgi:hypothetical protein